MRIRASILFLSAVIAGAFCHAQSAPAVDDRVVLQLAIASPQREFHIGETIPLELAFSSAVKDHYQINMATYDRSGRMSYEQFSVTPAAGAVDPLPMRSLGMMGGLTSFKFLSAEPWTIKLNLNEWLRFTQPGEYRLVVTSNRVGIRDPSNAFGASTVLARSNEVKLKIIAATRAWQKQAFEQALATIEKSQPAKPQELEQYTQSRRQALETLRFLGTPEAVRELARLMRGEGSDNLDYICMLGLISSPDREVARKGLAAALVDPDQPINQTFVYTMMTLESDPDNPGQDWRQEQHKTVDELLTALLNKRGRALVLSLNTVANEAWNNVSLSKETADKLADQLISVFDQLPVNEQRNLLLFRWDKIGGPRMLPILRRYARTYHDFPEMRDSHVYDALQLSADALRHWYELDPAEARPAIIAEITRPRPRFDARVLGLLPDKTLPEVDFALAEHLASSDDFEGSSNIASLIARYATDATLSQVLKKLDPSIGHWACSIQNPLLAYVLRVSPELARPRIEQAIGVRGKESTACNHGLFQEISEIHYDPLLEEIGIASLDDPDPQVAMTSATMLGRFGSPTAEAALWRRYASWNQKWSGHESELEVMIGEAIDDRTYELGLGQNLAQALATGQAWLTDKNKLQRLRDLTRVKRVLQQLEGPVSAWERQPLTIAITRNSLPPQWQASVAQYQLNSLDALKEKLAQFPAGTRFILSTPQGESAANDESEIEVREFLRAHGMAIEAEKPAD